MRRCFALLGLFALAWTQPVAGQVLEDLVDRTLPTVPLAVESAGKTTRFGVIAETANVPFTGIAVQARTPSDEVTAEVRFGAGGVWGPWMPLHVVPSATSDAFVAGWHGESVRHDERFEIRVGVPDGAVVSIDAVGTFDHRADSDRAVVPDGLEPLPAAASGTIIPPPLITREEWGAEPFIGTPVALARPSYDYMTFHHAAGYSATTLEEGLRQVKAIQDLHQNVRGWSDIGYQFLVDRGGRLYQGRPFLTQATSLEELPVLALGAHVGGANTGNIGISLLGCYHPPEGPNCEQEITVEAHDTYVTLFAFLVERYGVPPSRIRGHRDFSATACPGDNNYVLLPQIGVDMELLLETGNASLGSVDMEALATQEGVITLRLELVRDNGIESYRLERWIGTERAVLFDSLSTLPPRWADDGVLSLEEVEYRLYAWASDGRDQRLANVTVTLDTPSGFVLSEVFPNPTNGPVRIRYFVRQQGNVDIGLYDALGRRVRILAAGFHDADRWYDVTADTDGLPAGVYWYRIQADGFASNIFDVAHPVVVVH